MESLKLLLEHAERERDLCLAAGQTALAHHVAAQAQHEQLLAYRCDYEQRWRGHFGQQGQMELVRCYHGFMIRLSQAVEHQELAVQQAAQHLEAARAALREREVRVASVRKLIERRHRRVRTEDDRREQKLTDERGARQVQDSAFPSGMASMY